MNNNVSENPHAQHPATPKCVGEAISGTTAKELCAIDSGFAFDSEQFNTDGDGMPIIRIRDIKPGVTNTYTTEAFDSRYLVNDGDMLIGMDGEFNLVKWHSGSALLNQRVCRIQSKSTLLLDDYLRHFLPVALKQIEMRTACVTVKHLSIKALNAIEIPLVSMERQRAIAFQLDNIDEQLGIARKQLSMLDSLVKSRFVEMFGEAEKPRKDFPVKALNDVCSSIVRGPFGSALKKEFFVPQEANTYKVYEQKHAIQKRADIGTYYITRDRFETLKRFECFPGDILMSCSGTMGEFYQLPPSCEPGVMNQALCKFTLSETILSDYFLGFMEQVVDELGAKGSGIKNVSSVKYIKAIRIPLPPLELQRQFADFVTQVDKLRFEACYAMYFLWAALTLL